MQWDKREERRIIEEERRRAQIDEDFQFSGDGDSVISSDDDGEVVRPEDKRSKATELARQRLRKFLPQTQRPNQLASGSPRKVGFFGGSAGPQGQDTASPSSSRPSISVPPPRSVNNTGKPSKLHQQLSEISRQLGSNADESSSGGGSGSGGWQATDEVPASTSAQRPGFGRLSRAGSSDSQQVDSPAKSPINFPPKTSAHGRKDNQHEKKNRISDSEEEETVPEPQMTSAAEVLSKLGAKQSRSQTPQKNKSSIAGKLARAIVGGNNMEESFAPTESTPVSKPAHGRNPASSSKQRTEVRASLAKSRHAKGGSEPMDGSDDIEEIEDIEEFQQEDVNPSPSLKRDPAVSQASKKPVSSMRIMFGSFAQSQTQKQNTAPSAKRRKTSSPIKGVRPLATRLTQTSRFSQSSTFFQAQPSYGASQGGSAATALEDDIADFSDDNAAPQPVARASAPTSTSGGTKLAGLDRKATWLQSIKTVGATLPQQMPPMPAYAGGFNRRRKQGELESRLTRIMERQHKELHMFKHAVEAGVAITVSSGKECHMPWAVLLRELQYEAHLVTCRGMVLGVENMASEESCEVDVVFNLSPKNTVTFTAGAVIRVYQPWSIFTVPAHSRPVVLCGERILLLANLDLSAFKALTDSGIHQYADQPPPTVLIDAVSAAPALPSVPDVSVCDMPLKLFSGKGPGLNAAEAEVLTPITLIKDIDAWSCNINVVGRLVHICPRQVLAQNIDLTDAQYWMDMLARRSMAPCACEPSIFLADTSMSVVEVVLPQVHMQIWTDLLLRTDRCCFTITNLAVAALRPISRLTSAPVGGRALAESRTLLRVTCNSSFVEKLDVSGVMPEPMKQLDTLQDVLTRSISTASRSTMIVRVVMLMHPSPADRDGRAQTLKLAVWDASLPTMDTSSVLVLILEPYLCLACAANLRVGDIIMLADVVVLRHTVYDHPGSSVGALGAACFVIDSQSAVSVCVEEPCAPVSRAHGLMLPTSTVPKSALDGASTRVVDTIPCIEEASRHDSWLSFSGKLVEIGSITVAEACPNCPALEMLLLDTSDYFCTACELVSSSPVTTYLAVRAALKTTTGQVVPVELRGETIDAMIQATCPDVQGLRSLRAIARDLVGCEIEGVGVWWWAECDGKGTGQDLSTKEGVRLEILEDTDMWLYALEANVPKPE